MSHPRCDPACTSSAATTGTSRSASTRPGGWCVPDEPDVQRLLDDLASGRPPAPGDRRPTHRALIALDRGRAARRARRRTGATAEVAVVGAGATAAEATRILRAAGCRRGARRPGRGGPGARRRRAAPRRTSTPTCATAGRTWWSRPRRTASPRRAVRGARRHRLPALRGRPPRPARPAPGGGARAGRRPAGRAATTRG